MGFGLSGTSHKYYDREAGHRALNCSLVCFVDANRFRVQSVHGDDEDGATADSILDLSHSIPDVYLSLSESDLKSEGDLRSSHYDNVSVGTIGNRSTFSQITTEIIAAPGSVLPWFADPGNLATTACRQYCS